ncbi:ATP-binding protein [Sphingomonas sp. TZW2008]|uniref:ATP-binding protein n=1 Tax=Sphingomonas sp. TZW2008 TaxID=1917973 RepID=UPI000A269AA3|nr:ATP-binding protein [Sphingomonas sp. TZW2008]
MGILGVGVLVALILTLGEANRQRDRAITLQSHSYDVMILSRTLAGTIARSEASLGRYVISGDKQLGRLYYEDWRRAGDQLARLEALTRDNDEQQPLIDRLRDAYRSRGGELSLTALSTNYGKNAQALSRYYQSRKAASLAEINDVLDSIIAGERRLLDRRTRAAMALVDRSTRAAFVLSAFGVLLLLGAIALGWLSVTALTERATARAEADAERARAEELSRAVAAATDELRVQEARLRQVQKMDAVGQLTGGIAHDFNNMLAVVIGGLELARRAAAAGSGEVDKHLASASEGANRAADLTRRLLAFAREDAINPEPIEVGALIAGMRDLMDRTLGDGIRVEIVDRAARARVRADRVQLENTLLNLAVNARDAMEGRGTLTITAAVEHAEAAEFLTVAVADTGCGMTPEVAERVFEPFFTTKPVGKGTGLGLSQIFAFVRQLHGEVTIDTAPGAGTVVRMKLPRDTSAAPLIAVPAADHADEPAVAALTVLVVEDDPRVLAATTGALEELGHEAIRCDDPLEAPALLARHPHVDLIISDVLMPVRTGPEMIAALDPSHAHVAVLFVTGFAGETNEAGLFNGHHVLRKPFTLVGLERAIAEALSRARPEAPHRIAAE